jgi:L-ascorbate metabolism protein UlaG (beta-lactamase superfamily)
MDITYLGHSCFKLRGKNSTVITDPYPDSIGLKLPSMSADIVTVSHTQHDDHDAIDKVSGTARRQDPFVISAPGEYEIGGVSVFSVNTYHDNKQGEDRGKNTAYLIHIDDVRIAHLGDLGHELSDKQVEELGEVDVLLCPVGGVYTIDAKEAVKVINSIQPGIVIPMHFKTKDHKQNVFGKIAPLSDFLTEIGASEVEPQDKLTVSSTSLPEETEVVVLK